MILSIFIIVSCLTKQQRLLIDSSKYKQTSRKISKKTKICQNITTKKTAFDFYLLTTSNETKALQNFEFNCFSVCFF